MSEEEYYEIPEGTIVTSCRDCVFAEYNGTTQEGCRWDRLDKFEEKGADIVGQDDGLQRYFLVVGRFCNYCRDHDWGGRRPHHEWDKVVKIEAKTRCVMIIYADEFGSPEEVRRSLESVNHQTMKPHGVAIVVNDPSDDATRPYRRMIANASLDLPWELRHITEHDADMGRAIDITINAQKGATFYSVAKSGYEWPDEFVATIENAINEELDRFVALMPDDDGNGLTANILLHRKIQGNSIKDVLDKIREIASEEETGHMIKSYADLA